MADRVWCSGMADGPLIVACVQIGDIAPQVDPLTGAVTRTLLGAATSAADSAALEHALRIAERWSGRVVAIAAAGPEADPVLREAAATGAIVHRIDTGPTAQSTDERALADDIADVIRSLGSPALVLCGDRSADRGTGAFPAHLAGALGVAQALGLVQLAVAGDAPSAGLQAQRRLDAGRREDLAVPCPAVCSVEAAGVRLRRPALARVLATAELAIPVTPGRTRAGSRVEYGRPLPYRPPARVIPAPAGADARARLQQLTGVLGRAEPPLVLGPLDSTDAADALISYLERQGYLEPPEGPGPDDRNTAGNDASRQS
jgi:electron transfer flavoprotein beta subunit